MSSLHIMQMKDIWIDSIFTIDFVQICFDYYDINTYYLIELT